MSNFGANLSAFGDYRNVVVDLPGWGRSPRPATDEPLLFHAAERVCRAMTALGIERAHLVGNSYGGGVAMQDARIEECLHQSQNTFAADTLPHPCPSRLRAKIHRCTRRCHLP